MPWTRTTHWCCQPFSAFATPLTPKHPDHSLLAHPIVLSATAPWAKLCSVIGI
jgi:hypothetical protein